MSSCARWLASPAASVFGKPRGGVGRALEGPCVCGCVPVSPQGTGARAQVVFLLADAMLPPPRTSASGTGQSCTPARSTAMCTCATRLSTRPRATACGSCTCGGRTRCALRTAAPGGQSQSGQGAPRSVLGVRRACAGRNPDLAGFCVPLTGGHSPGLGPGGQCPQLGLIQGPRPSCRLEVVSQPGQLSRAHPSGLSLLRAPLVPISVPGTHSSPPVPCV